MDSPLVISSPFVEHEPPPARAPPCNEPPPASVQPNWVLSNPRCRVAQSSSSTLGRPALRIAQCTATSRAGGCVCEWRIREEGKKGWDWMRICSWLCSGYHTSAQPHACKITSQQHYLRQLHVPHTVPPQHLPLCAFQVLSLARSGAGVQSIQHGHRRVVAGLRGSGAVPRAAAVPRCACAAALSGHTCCCAAAPAWANLLQQHGMEGCALGMPLPCRLQSKASQPLSPGKQAWCLATLCVHHQAPTRQHPGTMCAACPIAALQC